MNLEMLPIEIIGLKSDLQIALKVLRRLGCIHIDELDETMQISARPLSLDRETLRAQEELSFLLGLRIVAYTMFCDAIIHF